MQSRLDEIEQRYVDLEAELANPEILTDQERLKDTAKRMRTLKRL